MDTIIPGLMTATCLELSFSVAPFGKGTGAGSALIFCVLVFTLLQVFFSSPAYPYNFRLNIDEDRIVNVVTIKAYPSTVSLNPGTSELLGIHLLNEYRTH